LNALQLLWAWQHQLVSSRFKSAFICARQWQNVL